MHSRISHSRVLKWQTAKTPILSYTDEGCKNKKLENLLEICTKINVFADWTSKRPSVNAPKTHWRWIEIVILPPPKCNYIITGSEPCDKNS